jgi:hypothetical protein
MNIYTTHVCYDSDIGVTFDGKYYELNRGILLKREYHNGAIYYRAIGSKKRYSWKKCNETKVKKIVEIIVVPF